ncbi:MAG: hypothetical protein EPO21_04320 [Chloroflexota bacterium]|nr:MAG: hypothetical protein EPO21_04320 [Chloroflexota bacterium]
MAMRRRGLLSIAILLWVVATLVLVTRVSSAWKNQPECPFYPGSEVARSSDGLTTYVSGDTFGQVLKWYENQHHGKGNVEVTPVRTPRADDITASYSLIIKHGSDGVRYSVTLYKFRRDKHTFIDVVAEE